METTARLAGAELAELAVSRQGAAQHVDELAQLVDYLTDRPHAVVVEVGVYKGGTLWLWRELGAELVVGVDREIVCEPCRRRRAHDSCPHLRIAAAGELVVGDSHEPSTRRQVDAVLAGRPVDLLHIDGDHTLAGVEQDHAMYRPLVRQGGTVVLHDTVSYPGVAQFWADELADQPGAFVIAAPPPQGLGLGVIPV